MDVEGRARDDEDDESPPTDRQAWTSVAFLVAALIAVVGLAKVESPIIEAGVAAAGFPQSFVGVVIALLVLLPETLAAGRSARPSRSASSRSCPGRATRLQAGVHIVLAVAFVFLAISP